MASVAADTSAIAPTPPLPSRPDAAPSGPSGGFADMLDAATPASTPPPPGAARTSDGPTTAQGGSAGPAVNGLAPAANGPASPGPRGSKAAGNGKDADDKTTSGDDAGAADVTVVAGVALPLAVLAPSADANQTPVSAQDAQADSGDAAAQTHDSDRKNTSAPSDSLPAGLVAALPTSLSLPVATAAPAATAPGDSRPAVAAITGVASVASSVSAPAAVPDQTAVTTMPPLPDGTTQPDSAASTDMHEALPAAPSAAALPPTGVQADAPTLPSLGETNPARDQNVQAVPAVAPLVTPSAPTSTPAAALNPLAAVTAQPASPQLTEQFSTNAASPRAAETIATALPAQVALRFAAPTHGNDDAGSDNGSDVLDGFAGATIGTATASSNGQLGASILPSFNGVLATMQSGPGAVPAPQHLAISPEAVPLAGIPIAIVTRAEAGERKFEIRLDPPDLGRIEVQLNVDSSGRATSHLVVDRPDTLDLLRRDAPALERALQSAGLTTDDGSLQFSLRDQSFAGRDQSTPAPLAPPPAAVVENDTAPLDTALRRYGASAGLGGGIDIRV